MSGEAVCVILAAGTSSRMGGPHKLLLPFRGATLLTAVLEACTGRPTVVVASAAVAPHVPAAADRRVVVNDRPELGMSRSLQLADAVAPPGSPLVVLLGDKPLLARRLVDAVVSRLAAGADVAYPVHIESGVAGHPVAFGARARARIAALPPGDSLKLVRDDPALIAVRIPIDDDGAFVDIDTADDYRRLLGGGGDPLTR